MPNKGKLPVDEKVKIVEDYLKGKVGHNESVQKHGIADVTFRRWMSHVGRCIDNGPMEAF